MATVIFSLGSNIGDREFHLEQARIGLQEFMNDLRASLVIETEPLYVTDQPAFLNQVVMGKADILPDALVTLTKALQQHIGRIKTFQNGPREIDIDMLYYDDLIINTDELVIPHPRIAERLFVLEPLCELMPDWICPVTRKSMQEMLGELIQREDG
ncbi:MAG: 2-amino-4-hydroxy-6-hydroxymethyldihydropteridine diphosphokinase [Pseudomonadota bacterium]